MGDDNYTKLSVRSCQPVYQMQNADGRPNSSCTSPRKAEICMEALAQPRNNALTLRASMQFI